MGVFGVLRIYEGGFAEDEKTSSRALDAALVIAIRAEPGCGGHGLEVSKWTVESALKRW